MLGKSNPYCLILFSFFNKTAIQKALNAKKANSTMGQV